MNKEEMIIKLLIVNQTLINLVLNKLGYSEDEVIKIVNRTYEEIDLKMKEILGENND